MPFETNIDPEDPGKIAEKGDVEHQKRGVDKIDIETGEKRGSGIETDDDQSVGRKPGEADAPNIPEKAKPSFE